MKVYYDKENSRLVEYEESATPDFWDRHWGTENLRESIEKGKNDEFTLKILIKYIPDKKGRILEGGCGRGQRVYCMHFHGYESVGIDFAEQTIEKTIEAFSELDIRVGDVRNLQFPDNYFRGYWSLGVIEHFWDGYPDILREMQRVLIKGGYVFLSFPYMSPLRRLKAKLSLYEKFNKDQEGNEDFYCFILNPGTVIKDFEVIGFELLEKKTRSGLKGLKDEVSLLKPLLQKLYDYQGKNLVIRGVRFILNRLFAPFAGHSLFLVFRNGK